MSVPPPDSAPILSAEIRPSQDETRPRIERNLADNQELCAAVARHIGQDFAYPYILQLERKNGTYNRIDDQWRATVARANLDIPTSQDAENMAKLTKGIGTANQHDARQAKVSPSAVHRRVDAIVNLGVALTWEGGELGVKAKKPKEVYEHPLYNPTEQGVELANTEMRRQAREIGLKASHRIMLANCLKYGHAFAVRDFERKLAPEKKYFVLSPDQNIGLQQLAAIQQKFGEPEFEVDEFGRNLACVTVQKVEVMRTNFIPLDCSAVFIDELMKCRPMERQPCPGFRLHINRWELEQNSYDPFANPFGWLNIDKAIEENGSHYALSAEDEAELRNRIAKRDGLNETVGGMKPRNTIKQLWTWYPLLAISEDGKLDTGEGCPCPACAGKGKIEKPLTDETGQQTGITEEPCPNCKGKGTYHPPTKRYVVQMFGNLYGGGSATVIRIQRNPTAKDKVPIVYTSHLLEDTATARPVSKVEICLSAAEELATCRNQFLDSKSATIRRGWKVPGDSIFADQPLNGPNVRIKYDSNPDEFERIESNNYDETTTLIPHMQTLEGDIEGTLGANDTVIGEISQGRRAASEITLANEGSKRPLVNFIDQVNADVFGSWGQAVIDDLEAWGDRDYLVKRTGRTTFGKIEIDTAVGEEMLRAQDVIAQTRYLLETFSRFPQFAGILPTIAAKFFEASKLDIDISAIDQGVKKSQIDAFNIMARILGDGEMLPPLPDDPDDIFVTMFSECLRDIALDQSNHWRQTVPQNIPILQQRLQMQQAQLMQKQMAQMQQQMAEQQMMNEANGAPNNNPPKRPNSPAKSPGESRQRQGD